MVKMTQLLFKAAQEPCEVFGEALLKKIPHLMAEETGRLSHLPQGT